MTTGRRAAPLRAWLLSVGAWLALTGWLWLPASSVLAAWSAPSTGSAGGGATTMPGGQAPSGGASGSSVTIGWPAATFPSGAAVSGYLVSRFNAATGSPATVGAGCSGIVTGTGCTEQSVAAGTWVYTDTPVQLGWTGTPSAGSPPISVG